MIGGGLRGPGTSRTDSTWRAPSITSTVRTGRSTFSSIQLQEFGRGSTKRGLVSHAERVIPPCSASPPTWSYCGTSTPSSIQETRAPTEHLQRGGRSVPRVSRTHLRITSKEPKMVIQTRALSPAIPSDPCSVVYNTGRVYNKQRIQFKVSDRCISSDKSPKAHTAPTLRL